MFKKFLIIFYFVTLLIFPFFIFAQSTVTSDQDADTTVDYTGISFQPAISIPDSIFAGKIVVRGDTLGKYIVAVYRYGGIFAGIVAMFMLVYAAWEWLLAGGNSSKISQAKNKISGTLIGLALLFGGYLLLSLISKNLISFKSLDASLPDIAKICKTLTDENTCKKSGCLWTPAVAGQSQGVCTAKHVVAGGQCIPEPIIEAINVSGIIISAETKDSRLTRDTISKLFVAKSIADDLGYTLVINGAFRTYAYQQFLFDCYNTKMSGSPCPAGCGKCNLASKPDCEKSSHMLGIAVDVCARKGTMDTCLYVDEAHNCTSPSTPADCAAVPGLWQAQDDLKTIMVGAKFKKDVPREWWHFTNK